jgi:hypothetical protein
MMAAGGSSAILSFDSLVISLAGKLLHLLGGVFCSILGPASFRGLLSGTPKFNDVCSDTVNTTMCDLGANFSPSHL